MSPIDARTTTGRPNAAHQPRPTNLCFRLAESGEVNLKKNLACDVGCMRLLGGPGKELYLDR
jgi:hypothetical protein